MRKHNAQKTRKTSYTRLWYTMGMKTILILLPNSLRFYAEFLSGIRRRMEPSHQLQVIDRKITRNTLRRLLNCWHPIGCIVDAAQGFEELRPEFFGETAVVYRDRTPLTDGDFLDVTQNYAENGMEAARILIRPEIDNYAFVGFASRTNWSVQRGKGFASVVKLNGKRLHRFENRRTAIGKCKELVQWLAAIPKPVAIFAANDSTAKDVLESCQQANVTLPEDALLLGIDNKAEICENVTPRISSISTDFEKSGWTCADLLYARLSNPMLKSKLRHYPTLGVVHRDTTFSYANPESRLIPALKLIRSRACDGITVEDVSCALSRPRRTAEHWFRQSVGKTIKEAITAVRMERAKVLLKSQGMSTKDLAKACGYSSDTAFRIAFKSWYGISLLEMRNSPRNICLSSSGT